MAHDFLTDVVYSLKQEYGKPVLFQRETESLDFEADKKVTQVVVSLPVLRVIVLPAELVRQSVTRLSTIVANREFLYDAYHDVSERGFIVDANDLGTFVPHVEDIIVYLARRWVVESTQRYDEYRAYFITARSTDGAAPSAQYNEGAGNSVIFGQSAEAQ